MNTAVGFIDKVIIYGLPLILAITLHEAAHGYAALIKGDDTAKRAGRLSVNPIKHVDLVGTILIPLVLLLFRAPFIFGYAKPVPVNFNALRNPRRDMVFCCACRATDKLCTRIYISYFISFVVLTSDNACTFFQRNA